MPYVKIQTNQNVPEAKAKSLLAKVSQVAAKQLGKPEKYVMVACQGGVPMLLGGSGDATAFVELKSIGLPSAKNKSLSKALCETIAAELSIPGDRVYIEFANAEGNMWGWNGDTF